MTPAPKRPSPNSPATDHGHLIPQPRPTMLNERRRAMHSQPSRPVCRQRCRQHRLDLEGGCKPDKKLFADSTGFDPKAMTEPDWVNQGEKVSAQDLVRRQREAQQNSREQRGSEGNTRPSSPT